MCTTNEKKISAQKPHQAPTYYIPKFYYGALILLTSTLIYPTHFNQGITFAGTSRDWCVYILSLILALLAVFPIIWPITLYYYHGQTARITRVKGFFSISGIAYYLTRFWKSDKACRDAVENYEKASKQNAVTEEINEKLRLEFGKKVNDTFGHDRFQQAMTFITLLAILVLFFAIEGGIQLARCPTIANAGKDCIPSPHHLLGIKLDLISLAAIFGAYTWITSDVIFRFRQSDLSSSDIYWYALRLIVAIPLGQAIGAAFDKDNGNGAVLAFVISMFSLTRIQQILGSLVNRIPGVPITTTTACDDIIIKLPGIDQSVSDRLSAENITTVAQLAKIDPVYLSNRAGIPFQILLGYIDSAILWQIVGPKLLILREFGWCGASDVISFAKRQQELVIQPIVDLVYEYNNANSALLKAQTEYEQAKAEADRISALANQTPADIDMGSQAENANKAANNKLEEKVAAEAKQNAALLALSSLTTPDQKLFSDISGKTGMNVSALDGVMKKLVGDKYAVFIQEMIQT